jgi:hypothetical protein
MHIAACSLQLAACEASLSQEWLQLLLYGSVIGEFRVFRIDSRRAYSHEGWKSRRRLTKG